MTSSSTAGTLYSAHQSNAPQRPSLCHPALPPSAPTPSQAAAATFSRPTRLRPQTFFQKQDGARGEADDRDNVHFASQSMRYTSMLLAWQARLAEQVEVVQVHAGQVTSLKASLTSKGERAAQLQEELRAAVAGACHAAATKSGHALNSKVACLGWAG